MKEHRDAPRYRLVLPVLISALPPFKNLPPLYGETRDFSTHEIYFALDRELPVGTKFDFLMNLPQGNGLVIDAHARVVRVEKEQRNTARRFGVAAVTEKYNMVRPENLPY
jgi:hypothetical protein